MCPHTKGPRLCRQSFDEKMPTLSKTQLWNDFNGMCFLCFCLHLASITFFEAAMKSKTSLEGVAHRVSLHCSIVNLLGLKCEGLWRCKAREMKCDLESLPWQHASSVPQSQGSWCTAAWRWSERVSVCRAVQYKSRKLLARPEKEEDGVWKQVLMHACVLDSFPNRLTSKWKQSWSDALTSSCLDLSLRLLAN